MKNSVETANGFAWCLSWGGTCSLAGGGGEGGGYLSFVSVCIGCSCLSSVEPKKEGKKKPNQTTKTQSPSKVRVPKTTTHCRRSSVSCLATTSLSCSTVFDTV